MLQALLNNKLSNIDIWKEDLKTSTVLGNLIYLPASKIYSILKNACLIREHEDIGELNNYAFWPKFSANDENITNCNFVEPDVILQFEKLDIIIEVKIGDCCGQYAEQWDNEVCSFFLEHEHSKPVILIALGGCTSPDKEKRSIKSNNKQINYDIYKSTWHSLLSALNKEYGNISDYAHKRIIENIILGLSTFGVHDITWLKSLNQQNLNINQSSISLMKAITWKR